MDVAREHDDRDECSIKGVRRLYVCVWTLQGIPDYTVPLGVGTRVVKVAWDYEKVGWYHLGESVL